MINTGIIRKIDELGRIVIPKEIRKNLNIKNNDDIEMYIEDEKIILKKYHKMHNLLDDFKKYIDIINEYTSFNVIITDLDKVLCSNKDYKEIVNKNITTDLLNIINERKKITVNNINPINIINGFNINTKYAIIPLIIDTNLLGSFIVISNEEINEKALIVINIIISLIKSSYE